MSIYISDEMSILKIPGYCKLVNHHADMILFK